jgi:DNA polymerase-1
MTWASFLKGSWLLEPVPPKKMRQRPGRPRGSMNKPKADTNSEKKETTVTEVSAQTISEVSSIEDWTVALCEAKRAGICGIDLETTSLSPLSGRVRLAQVALPDGRVYVADLFQPDGGTMLEALVPFIEDPDVLKVGHNLKFDLAWIAQTSTIRVKPKNIFDTMIASRLANAGYYKLVEAPKATNNKFKKEKVVHSLKDLAHRHLGVELDKGLQISNWSGDALSREQIRYAAEDAAVLIPLHKILAELLRKNHLDKVAEVEMATIPSIVEIELAGLPISISETKALLDAKETEVTEITYLLETEAQMAGFKPRPKKGKKRQELLNPDSSMDVLDYLRSLGYAISSTGEAALKELAGQGCAFAEHLLRYRRVKRQATFLKDWLLRLSPVDERLHPQYFQLASDAGRFSSRYPNGQQIPKRGEDGLQLRRLFRAGPGMKLIKADFSGIELRVMAHLSGDETMVGAFQDGQDLHKLTASKISGTPYDGITKDQRQGAKAVNFLLIYGGQPALLQERARAGYGVDMTLDEATEALKTFFRSYPGIERWHRGQRDLLKGRLDHWCHSCNQGFFLKRLVATRTVLGRRRVWGSAPGGYKSLATVNQLYNSPSQGTGADLLKLSMAAVYDILPPEAKMIATVHDEILIEAPEHLTEDLAAAVKVTMEVVGSTLLDPVPVEVEVDVVDTWGGDL